MSQVSEDNSELAQKVTEIQNELKELKENQSTTQTEVSDALDSILEELKTLNGTLEDMALSESTYYGYVYERESLADEEQTFNGFTESYFENQQDYQNSLLDFNRVSVTILFCILAFVLVFIGAYIARNVFRKL